MAHRIIIDTDPGQDDALAILLALGSPELEVIALTTVAGNVPLPLTTRNARAVLELAGRPDIPVYAGCDGPLDGTLTTAEQVHGATGLDGIPLPDPTMPVQDQNAVDFLVQALRTNPADTITLVAIGPLTNLAAAFRQAPDIAGRVRQIVLMGGASVALGKVTPAAEFNIFVDPLAAAEVLGAGCDVVMAPLDVTHRAFVDRAWLEQLAQLGRVGEIAASWTSFQDRQDPDRHGAEGVPLHDPCALAWLIAPQLLQGRRANVEVELDGRFTCGMTVIDWWAATDRPANALVLNRIDRAGFQDLVLDRIARVAMR